MKESIVALASIHHDPQGKLLQDERKALKLLKNIFDTLNVSTTHHTDKRVIDLLHDHGVHYERRQETGHVGERYRSVLRLALEDPVDHLLLVDFDRVLHWVLNFEEELQMIVEELRQSEGITSYIRTRRAFETHPATQRDTEDVANTLASSAIGKRVDITSGAVGLEKAAAKVLVKEIKKADFGFFGEQFAIPVKHGFRVNTIEVEGLEWETPDQYRQEINKIGYTQWLSNFESLEEWEKRLTLAFEAGKQFNFPR